MDEPLVETELAESEPQRRSGPWKLIALVAIATLAGVWLVPGDRDDETPATAAAPETAPSLLAETPPPAPALAGDPTIELDAPAAGGRVGRPGARARALIAEWRAGGAVDLDAVYEAARTAQADGELADAYLLYFYAAREGHAAAALALGTQADPGTRDPANSVFEAADLAQAHKWYQLAAQSGSDEAAGRLADLRGRVERMAAGGDDRAQRIALQWQ